MKRLRLCIALGLLLASMFLGPAASQAQAAKFFGPFITFMNGRQEVPRVTTRARGLAYFVLTPGRKTLHYCIVVVHIDKVFAAHIHLAPRGQNGPIAATLFQSDPPTGVVNGKLVFGSVKPADVGGRSAFNMMIQAMRRRNAYVNVHTTEHPAGEIRGQIRTLRRK